MFTTSRMSWVRGCSWPHARFVQETACLMSDEARSARVFVICLQEESQDTVAGLENVP